MSLEMAVGARVLLDLSPVLLATALARVLSSMGYEVDVGDPTFDADVAVVSERNGHQAPIVIELPRPHKTTATIFRSDGSRRVQVRDLRDLLEVVEHEVGARPLSFEV
jgi:hypothetical protein